MVLVDESVSVAEIDEAIAHAAKALKTDHYGNRMSWKKKALLESSIDDLLDERWKLMNRVEPGTLELVGAE